MTLVGGYGRAARPETITQKDKANSNAPTEDIARLAGARVVNISEPGKQMVLSASLVKTLTGRDTINARFLNENSFLSLFRNSSCSSTPTTCRRTPWGISLRDR